MTTIFAKTNDQVLTATILPSVASGNHNTVRLHVDFCAKWAGLTTSAVFYTSKDPTPYEVLFSTDGNATVPAEVLAQSGRLFIYVKGVSSANAKVKSSTMLGVKIVSGTPTLVVSDPTPSVYAQLLTGYGVLNGRVSAFTSLPEGSTTGDAELIDGRVDINGVKWANIGGHVRSVGALNSMLAGAVRFTSEKVETEIINGWVDIKGEYLPNESTGDTHKCVQIDVQPGEQYLIYSEYGWEMPDAVAKASDGGIVSIFNAATSRAVNNFDKVIVVPDGSAKLVVNCMTDYGRKPLVAKITGCVAQVTPDYIQNALISVKDGRTILGENLVTDVKTAYSLKAGEEFAVENGDTQFTLGECAVEPGKIYAVEAGAGFMCNPYIFYDASGLMLGDLVTAPMAGYQAYKLELIAPPGAAVLKVTQYGGVSPIVREVLGHTCAKEWTGLRWVCLGDSLTEENERTTKHYFDYVADKTGISVVNMGVGGTGYKRGEDIGKAFYQRIEAVPTDADVVTIFGSGNDLNHIDALGTPADTGDDTICGCINATLDSLFEVCPTARVGIVSPTPWVNNEPSDNGAMALYSEALKSICERRGIPFLDLFRCSGFRPNDETYRSLVFSKDDGNGVHPDEAGHKIIASHFKAFLETLIL